MVAIRSTNAEFPTSYRIQAFSILVNFVFFLFLFRFILSFCLGNLDGIDAMFEDVKATAEAEQKAEEAEQAITILLHLATTKRSMTIM